MADYDHFCERSITLWLITMGTCAFFIVAWFVVNVEDIRLFGESENQQTEVQSSIGQKVEESQPAVQLNQINPPASQNFLPVAVSKATINGGVQFVADPAHSSFQQLLKDAVNTIMPSVCDIHAIWTNRSLKISPSITTKNLTFLPPFDGTIDKFIQNRGYENIGSGFIIDERGYVLTNYHLTLNATDIKVTLPGNPAGDFDTVIVANDINNDLALLKINSNGVLFPEAKLGDSTFCEIGDVVIAIGSPFGMEQTVTSGIISGIRRSIKIGDIQYNNLFQTDAPINRGSSGGPLVGLNGEVIGINTAIYSPTGVSNGTGFAIPINEVKVFLSSTLNRSFPVALNKKGMFVNPVNTNNTPGEGTLPVRFGLEVMTLNAVAASQLGAKEQRGVLVNQVIPDTPADESGIKRGDIITSIAGVPVNEIDAIPGIVSHFKTGDSVNMRFIRNGKRNEILVRLW